MSETDCIRHYYVDEAGDLTLFDKKGRCIIGQEGVSKTFIVGVAHVAKPKELNKELTTLRHEMLEDPYFKGVPSMQPDSNKTSVVFHAKNDLPEVRRDVFKVLQKYEIKVQVAIKRKDVLYQAAMSGYKAFGTKLHANMVYGTHQGCHLSLLHTLQNVLCERFFEEYPASVRI